MLLEDKKIIDLYWNRNEQAIVVTKQKYEPYCMKIAKGILELQEDCEECVNDTWLNTWNAIPPKFPENLRFFLGKITRNLSFNRYKMNHAQKRGGGEFEVVLEELQECISAGNLVEEKIEEKELVGLINSFLEELNLKNRVIFVGRYWKALSMKELAKKAGTSEANVKMILSRTRKKLGEYLEKEGYSR